MSGGEDGVIDYAYPYKYYAQHTACVHVVKERGEGGHT